MIDYTKSLEFRRIKDTYSGVVFVNDKDNDNLQIGYGYKTPLYVIGTNSICVSGANLFISTLNVSSLSVDTIYTNTALIHTNTEIIGNGYVNTCDLNIPSAVVNTSAVHKWYDKLEQNVFNHYKTTYRKNIVLPTIYKGNRLECTITPSIRKIFALISIDAPFNIKAYATINEVVCSNYALNRSEAYYATEHGGFPNAFSSRYASGQCPVMLLCTHNIINQIEDNKLYINIHGAVNVLSWLVIGE